MGLQQTSSSIAPVEGMVCSSKLSVCLLDDLRIKNGETFSERTVESQARSPDLYGGKQQKNIHRLVHAFCH